MWPPTSADACGQGAFRALLLIAVLLAAIAAPQAEEPRGPSTERRERTSRHFGVVLSDDYAWLRTAKPDAVLARPEALEPPIRAHLDAERRYARTVLQADGRLERRLVAEMKRRIPQREQSVPETKGDWEYYARYAAGAQRRLHCRRPRHGGAEEVLLDENTLARGRRDFSLGETSISPDNRLIAYSVDEDGSERDILKVRDMTTGRDLADTIPEVRGSFVFSTDGQWLFYTRRDPTKWARAVLAHRIGTAVADDRLVYEEGEEGFAVSLRATLSERFLVIEAADFSTTDVKLLALDDPQGTPRDAVQRRPGTKYWVADVGDRLIVASNADGAVDWKIGARPLSASPAAPLEEIVAHVPGRILEDVVVFDDYLAWSERERDSGRERIRTRRWSDGADGEIAFGDEPAKVELLPGMEANTHTLRYAYQSMAQPRQVFDYDLGARRRTLRKELRVGGGFAASNYVTRRIEARSGDGTRVPVSVLYRADLPLDGTAPAWLYGYGAYGDTEAPEFGIERLSLVDRGFVYAIAHVRGGGEKGEAWHDAGRRAQKANSIADFIAAAEELARAHLTRSGRIIAAGASAGGTLVGAVVNARPDLFGAVYAEVPFVDCLNTLLDRSLPLTESSFSEFGNPIDSQADFLTLKSYAPYENVRAQAYPPMLVVQSINDSRVPYWEAAKWVAKLRQMKTDANPIVLFLKTHGGHSGGSGRFESLQDYARAYAFALHRLGAGRTAPGKEP
jgi:oligopeptidase B